MSSHIRILRHRDRVATPWANGGGITYEIARWPEEPGDFDWRLSIAEVATEGPFSDYPGIDRTLVLLSGQMRLSIDGVLSDMAHSESIAFPGESKVSAQLPCGPTMDFNVMSRRGRITAEVKVVAGPEVRVVPEPGSWGVALVVDGIWNLGEGSEPLTPWDCALGAEPFAMRGQGLIAHVLLTGIPR